MVKVCQVIQNEELTAMGRNMGWIATRKLDF